MNRRRCGRGLVGSVIKRAIVGSVGKVLKREIVGSVVNRAIDALPVELHLPGYRFCGPGTKLSERLARGERGINQLDEACREHDIAYSRFSDNERRRKADRKLVEKAWQRVKASDSNVSERVNAAAVAAAMTAKSTLGAGRRNTKTTGSGSRRRPRRRCVGRRKRRRRGATKAAGLYLRPYRKN